MSIVRKHLLILLIAGSLGLFALALAFGLNPELSLFAASAASLAVAHVLERQIPFRADWRRDHGDKKLDLLSAGVLIGIVDPLVKAIAPVFATWIYSKLVPTGFISGLPLFYQIIAVLLVVEFGKYWSHRLHHAIGPLWWLHAMHHSSERLYYLNGLRFHPLNYLINSAFGLLPALLLGASTEAVVGYLAIAQPVVLLQHANIDLRMGWVNTIFSTPEVHRWHHSTAPQEANTNYGNAILLWDHVFGTYRSQAGFTEQHQIGLFASSRKTYPGNASYLRQLLSMFRPPCCVA